MRHAARPVDQVIDEVEQARRPPSADPRRRAPAAVRSASASKNRRQAANDSFRRSTPGSTSSPSPTSGTQMALDPVGLCLLGHDRPDRAAQLCRDLVGANRSRGSPAWALTISASAQKLDALAVRQRAALPPDGSARGRPRRPAAARRRAGSCRCPARPRGSRAGRRAAAWPVERVLRAARSSRWRPTSCVFTSRSRSTPNRARGLDRLPDRNRLGLSLRLDRVAPRGTRSRAAVARYVVSPTRMPFTGAADCSRAAVLTTSPAGHPLALARRAPMRTSASPVFTAIRTSRSLLVSRPSRGSRAPRGPLARGRPRARRARRRSPSPRRR